MSRSGKKPPPPEAPAAPFHNPFAGLAAKREALPPGPAAPTKKAPSLPPPPERAVVRMERAGRRGKEVTVVEKLGLPAPKLEEWLKALKQTLGCGGTVEDDALVLQGDHRERVQAWLETRGVRRVSVG